MARWDPAHVVSMVMLCSMISFWIFTEIHFLRGPDMPTGRGVTRWPNIWRLKTILHTLSSVFHLVWCFGGQVDAYQYTYNPLMYKLERGVVRCDQD